jgi:HTH-type transcriptional regulator/antitoxin HigA
MKLKVIKTEEEYNEALERLETVFNAEAGTAEGDELDSLATLIEQYEDERFPIVIPVSIEYIN